MRENDFAKTFGDPKDYVWHCPNLDCKAKGIVLLKTRAPYLGNGCIKCVSCGKVYDFMSIMSENIRTFERFLAELQKYKKKT